MILAINIGKELVINKNGFDYNNVGNNVGNK